MSHLQSRQFYHCSCWLFHFLYRPGTPNPALILIIALFISFCRPLTWPVLKISLVLGLRWPPRLSLGVPSGNDLETTFPATCLKMPFLNSDLVAGSRTDCPWRGLLRKLECYPFWDSGFFLCLSLIMLQFDFFFLPCLGKKNFLC